MSQEETGKEETKEEKELREKKAEELRVVKEYTLNAEEEIRVIAEWFFRQKVKKIGVDYIQLADGTNVEFMLDADNNLMDVLESKMIEEAEIDHIGISFSRNDPDNRVRYSYYKLVTAIGTSYMMSATGRDSRDARKKALLKHIRRNIKI